MPEPYDAEPVIEFAFGSTWSDDPAGFTWTDVSDYGEVINLSRGRTSELDLFSASTLTVTLNNDDRRFDPLNTAGPYYGQLKPNVPVRIRALHNAVYYPVWYGYTDGFKHQPGTFAGTVTVPCTDAFKYLAGQLTPATAFEYAVKTAAPSSYWTLASSEGDTSTKLAPAVGSYDASLTGAANATLGVSLRPFSTGISLPSDGIQTGENTAALLIPQAARPDTDGGVWAVQFGVRVDEALDPARVYTFYLHGTTNAAQTHVWLTTTGFGVRVGALGSAEQLVAGSSVATTLANGSAHLVTIVWDANTATRTIYVNVAAVPATYSTGAGSYNALMPSEFGYFGKPVETLSQTPFTGLAFSLCDVAIWNGSVPSSADIADIWAMWENPWNGDTTGERIGRLLDVAGWPAALRDIDRGDLLLGNADFDGSTVLDYLQLLTLTEQGRLFVSADGKVTFHGTDRTLTGDSAYTFTDDGTGAGIVEGSLTFTLDNTFLFDGAIIQRKYGVDQRAVADGITYPSRVYEQSGLLMTTDRLALSLAQRIVFRYGTERTRAEAWTVQPQNDPDSWPQILGLEIGDVVTLTVTPQGSGDPISVDLFLEQITHEITPEDWLVTFWGSPVDPTNYLTIGSADPDKGIGAAMR